MRKHIFGSAILALLLSSCSFFTSLEDNGNSGISINSISMPKTTLSTQVGSMEYISISVKPSSVQKDVKLNWSYDSSIIQCDTSSNWGVTIKGLAEGQTTLRCSYGGYDASCMVTVNGYAENYENVTEPYIYSNYSILQTTPGVSEKVFVSLYGGDASDIDGYSWTIDNSSVINIQPTGQYCMITAKEAGYSRIKITHPKATYPYYMGIYVFEDATKVSYITTANNIVTMNQDDGDKSISVSLVNGKESSLDSQFKWEILNDEGSETPVALSANGNNAVISPKRSGSCTVRVTHPDAVYPLDILCRVITIVKNVYIQPDNTVITLSGTAEETVTSELVNLERSAYNIDGFKYMLDDYNVAEIVNSVGNQVTLRGIANGSCKLIISHEKTAYAREVLLIVNGQLKDAVDASCYVTTSQNYIRTKVGADGQTLNISLKGGEDGDEANFQWSVKSTAADGSSAKVIDLETATGSVFHVSARAAAATYSYGSALMTPLCEGTAVITITHPKIVYPTEILVKVLSKDAVLEEPLYFVGGGLVKILNGEEQSYSVQLKGKSKKDSDEQNIKWNWDSSILTLSPAGTTATITAPAQGSGCTTSSIKIEHPKADNEKSVLVMTADDIETLNSMKALYADKLYYNLEIGKSATVMVSQAGFDSYDEATDTKTNYDFSPLQWTVKDPSIISIEKNALNPLTCSIKALKAGQTTLSAKIDSYSCDFKILVYPTGTVVSEPEVYFTTSQNVINLKSCGKSIGVSVSAVNLNTSKYSEIDWTVEDSSICSVIPNGINATITATSEGETVIHVNHPDSQNEVKIYVRIGSEYVIPETEPLVYISASDVMTFLKDGQTQTLQAILVNSKEEHPAGFTFEIDNESVAKITAQSPSGTAYIKPVDSGQAQITITNTATDTSKQVLVVVGNSEEELAGFTYLTTNSNVVSIGEGNAKNVSVSIKNAENPVIDGYSWSTSNSSVVDISASETSAILKANSIGTALITVTNRACKYPLTIIAQVVDPIAANASPYIQLSSSVLTLTVSSNYTSLTADLIGGHSEDYQNFIWQVQDSSICAVYGQNEVGKIRALKAGQTYVTVSHPKSAYTAQLLVVCEEAPATDCYISVPGSIITMKPNASSQTITASLINGSATDKYNFSWSLDVYDIIDVQYSANVCTITPKQTGTATITITHPKAAYSQQIIVNVQEYSNFAFPQLSSTITQGTVSFLTMQVPTTSVTTHVEYSVDNSSICSISGTKAVAQITGIAAGTTTVRAKLVATSTGVTQAESEMLIYVEEAPINRAYISSSSTIYTVNKGKSQTLSAMLSGSGITNTDLYNLKWTTSDSDIIQITGISSDGTVTGQSIYITALKSGEALITCSHEKAASTLQFYVVVPGTGQKSVTLNKSYMTLTKGSSGSQLKATVENAEGNADYNSLIWTCEGANGVEVARIMGSGQTVTIYPITPGEATVTCQHPDSSVIGKCTVIVEAGKTLVFETNSRKVQPFHTKKMKYTVSPPTALLSWTISQDDDYFEYRDLGCDENGNGEIEIIGMKEGNGTLVCVTDGNAKAQCTVKVAWDYEFSISGASTFTISPLETKEIDFQVSPADAVISVESTDANILFNYEIKDRGDGSGTVIIKPIAESPSNINIKIVAKNPKKSGEIIGEKNITAKFQYQKLELNIGYVGKTGNFSVWSATNKSLLLGDGEDVSLKFEVSENQANGTVSNVEFAARNGALTTVTAQLLDTTEKGRVYKICDNSEDSKENIYFIKKAWVPTIDGQTLNNWRTDMNWYVTCCYHKSWNEYSYFLASNTYTNINSNRHDGSKADAWLRIFVDGGWSGYHHLFNYPSADGNRCGRVLAPELSGTEMTVSEFTHIPWFYSPGSRWGVFHNNDDSTALCTIDETVKVSNKDDVYIENAGGIVTQNVEAELRTTTNKTVVQAGLIGELKVTITHNGKPQTPVSIPVYYEKRNCSMYQQ